jgi:hypothetical protein
MPPGLRRAHRDRDLSAIFRIEFEFFIGNLGRPSQFDIMFGK